MRSCRPLPCFPSKHPRSWPLTRSGPRAICTPSTALSGSRATRTCAKSLTPVSPKWLRPVFKSVFRQLQRGKALEPMAFLDGHYLLALDGTGYFSSKTIHCASCLHKVHRNGSITYAHQMLGAAIIHPDSRAVIPLMPEPIVNHDGTDKNDCERNAAKRFITKLRQDHPHLKFIVTEDSLSSNAPHIETLQRPRSALYPGGQRRRSCLSVPAGAGSGARWARHLL